MLLFSKVLSTGEQSPLHSSVFVTYFSHVLICLCLLPNHLFCRKTVLQFPEFVRARCTSSIIAFSKPCPSLLSSYSLCDPTTQICFKVNTIISLKLSVYCYFNSVDQISPWIPMWCFFSLNSKLFQSGGIV